MLVFAVTFIQIVGEGLLPFKWKGNVVKTILPKENVDILENRNKDYEKYQLFNEHEVWNRIPEAPRDRQKRNAKRDYSSSTCTRKKAVFKNRFSCYYDNACFETFHDCCTNYEKRCGNQKVQISSITVNTEESTWTCVTTTYVREHSKHCGIQGVWMIQKCPLKWPSDKTKFDCENPPNKFSFPIVKYLPVVGENNITYRNKYCAVCHGITRYSSWNIRILTYITLPAEYDLEAGIKLMIKQGGKIPKIEPSSDQPRRYCIIKNDTGGCSNSSHPSHYNCVNGPVEVVSDGKRYFKNRECALCRGFTNISQWKLNNKCPDNSGGPNGPGRPEWNDGRFSTVFHVEETASKATLNMKRKCGSDLVFDKNLGFCRIKGKVITVDDVLSNQYFIALWLVQSCPCWSCSSGSSGHPGPPGPPGQPASYPTPMHMENVLEKKLETVLKLKSKQVSATSTYEQTCDEMKNKRYIVVTFRVTLTPFQVLARLNQSNHTIDSFSQLPELMKDISYLGSNLLVINSFVKQLACVGQKTFSINEYKIDEKNGKVIENKTGKTFLLKDVIEKTHENITLCPQTIFSDCEAWLNISRHEYVILTNLTLYHNATNRMYPFGNYYIKINNDAAGDVVEDVNVSTLIDEFSKSLRNSTVFICLPNIPISIIRSANYHDNHKQPLEILTMAGFIISILSVVLVLITYTLFSELRTLPGKNLMNLCLSLLIYQSVWLVRSYVHKNETSCTVIAILEHYFILVSFVAMSVISHHSCVVFSKNSISARRSEGENYDTFIKYTAVVWTLPAAFVVVCIALDKTEVFPINYGTICFLATKNSKIYLFILPIGLSLLFNLSIFIRTAIYLLKQQESTGELHQNRKQNLKICIKLSTLTGFPWIFGFLHAGSGNIVTFEYLFVIFVCLQGLYLAVAFLWNTRVHKLYKNRFNNGDQNNNNVLPVRAEVTTSF